MGVGREKILKEGWHKNVAVVRRPHVTTVAKKTSDRVANVHTMHCEYMGGVCFSIRFSARLNEIGLNLLKTCDAIYMLMQTGYRTAVDRSTRTHDDA